MWAGVEGGGGGGGWERSVSAPTAKIWGSHIKGPRLADEGAVSNSASYYYSECECVSLQRWEQRPDIKT